MDGGSGRNFCCYVNYLLPDAQPISVYFIAGLCARIFDTWIGCGVFQARALMARLAGHNYPVYLSYYQSLMVDIDDDLD